LLNNASGDAFAVLLVPLVPFAEPVSADTIGELSPSPSASTAGAAELVLPVDAGWNHCH
jgi:hypothetical protein